MKLVHGLEALSDLPKSVLTIGNFDGVHLAHQQLLAQAGMFAAKTGGPVVVLTFEPHPLTIVAPHKAPPRLSTPQEKVRLLAAHGADTIVVARSEPALLSMEAERFIEEVLIARFHPTHIVEGPSFGFGKGRRGTPELLKAVAGRFGCEVHILQPVALKFEDSETVLVSSSLIRRMLGAGKIHQAALCLGRPYVLTGKVVEGRRRGRMIGFPTANVAVEDLMIPADGVYSGWATVEHEAFRAAISIGNAPTFGDGVHQVEAYLLDFSGDLYGAAIRIEFDRLLRAQQKFDSLEALKAQLARDVEDVRGG